MQIISAKITNNSKNCYCTYWFVFDAYSKEKMENTWNNYFFRIQTFIKKIDKSIFLSISHFNNSNKQVKLIRDLYNN